MNENLYTTEKYEKGDRLRADTVNALVEAVLGHMPVLTSSPTGSTRWPLPLRNVSGEDFPAHGVGMVNGTEQFGKLSGVTITKPDNNLQQLYVVNGPKIIPNGKPGWGTMLTEGDLVRVINFEQGKEHGVKAGSFFLAQGRYGFVPLGSQVEIGGFSYVRMQQHMVHSVLAKCNTVSQGSPWNVDAQKTVQVYGHDWLDIEMQVQNVFNYTVKITDSGTKLAMTWFSTTPIAAPLKC